MSIPLYGAYTRWTQSNGKLKIDETFFAVNGNQIKIKQSKSSRQSSVTIKKKEDNFPFPYSFL